METEIVFAFKGVNINSDQAEFAGYKGIEGGMANNTYLNPVVPTLLQLDFLSPLPLPVPPDFDDVLTSPPESISSSRSGRSSLSPVTVGVGIATIMGGLLVSAATLSRNRRARERRRQDELSEEDMDIDSRNPVSI